MALGVGGDLVSVITKRPLGLSIRSLTRDDPSTLSEAFSLIGWHKPAQLFRTYLEECHRGQRVVLVARVGKQFAGYGTVVWRSPYEHFREQEIPEIKDLNVLPAFRRQGIGTALVEALESGMRSAHRWRKSASASTRTMARRNGCTYSEDTCPTPGVPSTRIGRFNLPTQFLSTMPWCYI
jgi:GNAT superfamily N-acetyltransferase